MNVLATPPVSSQDIAVIETRVGPAIELKRALIGKSICSADRVLTCQRADVSDAANPDLKSSYAS